jgi:hypothetical protein
MIGSVLQESLSDGQPALVRGQAQVADVGVDDLFLLLLERQPKGSSFCMRPGAAF